MIWATVSSQSCFCLQYRASASLAAKNIINLILVLTIWWCPCVESSLVLLEIGVCYDQCVLLAKLLLAFAQLHFIFQGQTPLVLQVLLPSYFCIPVPYDKKDIFFLVLPLGGVVSLHRTIQLELSTNSSWGIDLHYCDSEWFALERNRDHSVILETASKYCILDSSVDYEKYSISSKGFLLTVDGKSPVRAQECGEVGEVCCLGNRYEVPTSISSLCL